MSFTTNFKNLGHYLAVGFKYVSTGVGDVVKFANKAQPLEPEVDLLAQALAGPVGAQISDLAFHSLGSLAAALEPVGTDAGSLASAQSQLSTAGISLDVQTLADIKNAAATIKSVLGSVKLTPPAK